MKRVPAAMAALRLLFLLVTPGLGINAYANAYANANANADPSDHQHVYTDSFPRNDEYDMMALEPETPYGTPYGGFSRATASRLAALPLKLPSITKEMGTNINNNNNVDNSSNNGQDGFEPMYTTVRDHFGRAFACRVFHEDELEPSSLGDSMFDTPVLKKVKASGKSVNKSKRDGENSDATSGEGSDETEGSESNEEGDGNVNDDVDDDADDDDSSLSQTLSEIGFDPIMMGHTIHQRLTKLTGLCAQLHPGTWWSYEWCHEESVKQFHVKISKYEKGKATVFDLEGITSLGSYSGRRIEVTATTKDGDEDDETHKNERDLAQDRTEIGRVVDTFYGGSTCAETGKPRVTDVTFRCCSERHLRKTTGGVLKQGKPVDTDIVSIFSAVEDPERVCHYNITLCTPLLCADYDDGTGASPSKTPDGKNPGVSALQKLLKLGLDSAKNKNKNNINKDLDPTEAATMSVSEILRWTFGEASKFCIRQQTAGWWSYEFCPGDYVRQYHEDDSDGTQGITTSPKKASGRGVTEYFLGRYVAKDHEGITRENEWEHVVNATSSSSSSSREASPGPESLRDEPRDVTNSKSESNKADDNINNNNNNNNNKAPTIPFANAGGNGAYYIQEYTNGDVCNGEDVTESAMSGIERAITVRYACNDDLSITVKEDSTCHYILDVTLPTLCHHPLFKAPVVKRQVVKCLPIAS